MPPRFSPTDTASGRTRKLNELHRTVEAGGGGVYVLVDLGGGAVELRELVVSASAPPTPTTGDLWVDIA